MSVPEGVTVVDHVLLRRLVSILRDRETPHGLFRQTLDDAGMILAYEAMRGLRPDEIEVQTPLEPAAGVRLADQVVIVAILRAGLGLVDGFLRLVPDARVGHLGMYRDEEALRPVGYYENIPSGVEDAEVFVVDPMLAIVGRTRAELEAGEISWRAITAPEWAAQDDQVSRRLAAEGWVAPYEK